MKKLILTLLGLCLIAGSTTLSRAADETTPKKDTEARKARLLKKYDKNGDGKLDDSERAAMKEDMQKKREARKSPPTVKPAEKK